MKDAIRVLEQTLRMFEEHELYRDTIQELTRLMVQFRNDVRREHPTFTSESLERINRYVMSNRVVPDWMDDRAEKRVRDA